MASYVDVNLYPERGPIKICTTCGCLLFEFSIVNHDLYHETEQNFKDKCTDWFKSAIELLKVL